MLSELLYCHVNKKVCTAALGRRPRTVQKAAKTHLFE